MKKNDGDLYKWQKDCIAEWEAAGCRGIVNAVTGSGKTRLALAAAGSYAMKHPGARIRIVAPTIALANQWRQALIRMPGFASVRPGFYGDGVRDDPECRVMIYVINSARRGLAQHIRRDFALGRHVMLICDECHRYKSRENHRIFSFIDRDIREMELYSCLGLSATPFSGTDDELLTDVMGPEIYRYDLRRAADERTIATYAVCQVAADFMEEEAAAYRDLSDRISKVYGWLLQEYPHLRKLDKDRFIKEVSGLAGASDMDPSDPAGAFMLLTFQRKEISVLAEARTRCCIDLLDRLKDRGRMLIFSERIEQAEKIYSVILRRYGNIAGLYHSGMTKDARNRVLEDFREERTGILVSCRCLDEGLDVPDACIGIVVSGSSVPRQRIQRLGRIIRQSGAKESACLYYIYMRESSDEQAYLPGLDAAGSRDGSADTFDLRYYSSERIFSNDLYEYAAAEVLRRASANGAAGQQLAELRSCIQEGVCLPDYLQDDEVLDAHIRNESTVHARNYYRSMKSIHRCFTDSAEEK